MDTYITIDNLSKENDSIILSQIVNIIHHEPTKKITLKLNGVNDSIAKKYLVEYSSNYLIV